MANIIFLKTSIFTPFFHISILRKNEFNFFLNLNYIDHVNFISLVIVKIEERKRKPVNMCHNSTRQIGQNTDVH